MKDLIYLDNAATTYPKPKEVLDFMFNFYRDKGINPGRSSYDASWEVEDMVYETRQALMKFFNGGTVPDRLVFSYNASDSLNIAIQGILKNGDHAICTTLEHNSVLRPLYVLSQKKQIKVDYIPFGDQGYVDPDNFKAMITNKTRLVVVNHGSNVIGTVQPIREIGKICRERGVTFLVDAAQTAGMIPIDMEKDNIDIVAFTGHKSLFGPTGIGGMYVREGIELEPLRFGGTGVKSAVKTHLPEYPFRLECGTLNILGVAGLYEGQKFLSRTGIETVHKHEMKLLKLLIKGLKDVPGVKLFYPDSVDQRCPVLSFLINGYSPGDVGTFLDVDYNIATRTGLQCAPLVHDSIGTAPKGTVRFSIGYYNSEKEIKIAIDAVKELSETNQGKNTKSKQKISEEHNANLLPVG